MRMQQSAHLTYVLKCKWKCPVIINIFLRAAVNCVSTDPDGGLVRPEGLLLIDPAEEILLDGMPAAKKKKKKVTVIWSNCSSFSVIWLGGKKNKKHPSQIYRCEPSFPRRMPCPHLWAVRGLISGANERRLTGRSTQQGVGPSLWEQEACTKEWHSERGM